jgi:hypothetical protein
VEFKERFPKSPLQSDAEALRWEIELRFGKRADAVEHLRDWLTKFPDHRLSNHVRALLSEENQDVR